MSTLTPPPFVFPLHHARHDSASFSCAPCPSLSLPPVEEPKQYSPSRTHAHRRSAAVSHDFLADLKHGRIISSSVPAPHSPDVRLDERDRLPSPPASPCRSSSVSLASSSAASLASVSSTSTSPPSRLKVMFSPSVEFIPSHSSTTSTSTTTTITAARGSADLTDESARPEDQPQPDKRRSQKKSWSFIRFRRRSAEAEDEDGDDDEDDDDVVPPPRSATPPRPSHARATHYFTGSGTPEPMIDLDAALGPAGTPPLLSGTWSSGATMHRRSESAPEMLAWTGTTSVDFRTFSSSMARVDGSRGMKRKMAAVVEVEESAEDEAAAAEEAQPEPVATPEPDRRRSVWDEFVNSFAVPEAEQADNPSSPHVNPSSDEVLVVDEFGEVIVIGEPGPEIRHELTTADNANSVHSSCPVSTFSDAPSVYSSAGSETVSEILPVKSKRYSRRLSLVLNLKNAMLKSASVGNLIHVDDHKPVKLHRRRNSKLDTITDTWSKELNRKPYGLRSHDNLPTTNIPPIEDPLCQSTGPAKSTSSSSSLHSRSPAPTDSTQQSGKSKNMASRMWDWVRGIVA
ncbi:uncharacterized protein V1513DRAFT_204395 [Lipomyces chichibuensis]|uniref:uncharacterized protein n=1 Tax=Lipomyces chichibuensis TaxID=1546026 RepID=UPI003342EA93